MSRKLLSILALLCMTLSGAWAETIDLSAVSANTTAQDGDELTGTLEGSFQQFKISIADGATVTLNGAIIQGYDHSECKWAGLTCLGDATIVLADGTTNSVEGFYNEYPGIYVPVGSTLTIQGSTGTLVAVSTGMAAGIGGGFGLSCGNIEIQGGDITALSYHSAAGIGGGNGTCGNILISGGTIFAGGGKRSPGIGSGYGDYASCGDITITKDVTHLTAVKGNAEGSSVVYFPVGKAIGTNCGTVTIGGKVYYDGSAYQNGGEAYLTAGLIEYYNWTCGGCDVSLLGGDLTVSKTPSGTGVMADCSSEAPWKTPKKLITNIIVQDGVKNVSSYAFEQCENLETVSIGDDVETIEPWAFTDCDKLATVSVGSGLKHIDDYAFMDCDNTYVSISLNSNPLIGSSAFASMSGSLNLDMSVPAHEAGGAKWTTFYNEGYFFQADAKTQVFKVQLIGTGLTLHEVSDQIADAGVAYVLKTTGGGNPVMTLWDSSSSNSDANSLNGVYNPNGVTTDGTFYVLNNGPKGVGFYKLSSGGKVGVGKAYLSYSSGGAPEFFAFDEDSADNIVSPLGETEEGAGAIYNLAGQRLQKMQRGINIVSGKKIIK